MTAFPTTSVTSHTKRPNISATRMTASTGQKIGTTTITTVANTENGQRIHFRGGEKKRMCGVFR